MKILVIDDSEEILDLIKYCVGRSWPDAEIKLYPPTKGIPDASFGLDKYDLLILDYQLGLTDQDGFDWLQDLTQYPNIPPILFMTSYGDEDTAVRAIKLGADDYLNKDGLSPKRFTQRVNEILNIKVSKVKGDITAETTVKKKIAEFEQTVLISASESLSSMVLTGQKQEAIDAEKTIEATGGGFKSNVDKTLLFAPDIDQSLVDTKIGKTTLDQFSVSPIPSDEKSGDAINVPGYKILDKVGEGGMASVYLAERSEDKLQIILKVLHTVGEANREMLRRFIREFRLVSQLDHPNIASIYEQAISSNFAYIAMEYCPEGDLSHRLDKALPTDVAVKYMRQIAAGVGAAHKLGIIHRDMKPGNVLFREDDSVAITDFGIAMVMGAESELTVVGSIVGTILYISPEQISGRATEKYSDLYSLGVMFYKMLTGKYPFFGDNVQQILHGHLTAPIPKLPSELSSFQPIIDGLLAKDPNERFQSTEEFIVGLEW